MSVTVNFGCVEVAAFRYKIILRNKNGKEIKFLFFLFCFDFVSYTDWTINVRVFFCVCE